MRVFNVWWAAPNNWTVEREVIEVSVGPLWVNCYDNITVLLRSFVLIYIIHQAGVKETKPGQAWPTKIITVRFNRDLSYSDWPPPQLNIFLPGTFVSSSWWNQSKAELENTSGIVLRAHQPPGLWFKGPIKSIAVVLTQFSVNTSLSCIVWAYKLLPVTPLGVKFPSKVITLSVSLS